MKIKKCIIKKIITGSLLASVITLPACAASVLNESGNETGNAAGVPGITSDLSLLSCGLSDPEKVLDILRSKTEGTAPSKFILYISGIDLWGDVSAVSRSDVNLLVAVNREKGEIAVVNTPRDAYVKLPQSGEKRDKLTHAGLYGITSSRGTLENLYGIKIDHYLRLNFTGFQKFVDALGGIDVYSEQDFEVVPIKHYKKGINHLTGIESLAFVRERKSFADGDYQRGRHQMQMAKALVSRLTSFKNFSDFEKFMRDIDGNYETDMSEVMIKNIAESEFLSPTSWNAETYTTKGTGSYETTYSVPSQALYVTSLDETSVNEASALLNKTVK